MGFLSRATITTTRTRVLIALPITSMNFQVCKVLVRYGEDRETEPALKAPDLTGSGFVKRIAHRSREPATEFV